MKTFYLVLWACCFFAFSAFAQERSISGQVKDAKGEPLIGVTIVGKGTTTGTVTDVAGKFSLKVPANVSVLIFSSIGYKSQEVEIGNQAIIDLVMQEDIAALEEIVVIGYGTQKRSEITGSVASVTPEEITQTPVLRVEQAIQGRVTGVQVTNSTGQPGDAPTIRIRGTGTVGDANPLYIVDGVLIGGIDYLNPNDIESIDVLKDAASAAIYGVRGANGVVLITTKGGKAGKTLVSYDGYVGVQNPWRKVNVLNAREYALLQNEAHAASNLTVPFSNPATLGEGTDWQEALFGSNAPIASHQLNVSGGNEKSTFAASVGYFTQQGIIGGDKSQFDRITARINSNHKVSEKFTFGQNFSYARIDRQAIDGNSEFGGLLSNSLNLDPLTPVIETDPARLATFPATAVRNSSGQYYGISQFVSQEIVNPLARLEVTNGRYKLDKIVGNLYGEYEIIKGLKLRTTFGIDLAYGTGESFQPIYFLNGAQSTNETRVSKNVDRFFTWLWENTLSYQKSFGNHNLSVLLGTATQENLFENIGGGKSDLVFNSFDNAYLSAATNEESQQVFGGASESAFFSYFGRLMYDYQGKYLVSVTVRRDGSSRFGANNRYATFPSVSLGWVLSSEEFMKDVKFIDFLKLRASWGQNGNANIGDYTWTTTVFNGAGYAFGDGTSFVPGSAALSGSNADLGWERSEQLDLGVDVQFLEGRLSFVADYYVKTNKDLLFAPVIPGVAGSVFAPTANAGEVQNRGIEFAINYRGEAKDLNYNIGLNFSYNKNEFTKITNNSDFVPGAAFSTYGLISRAQVGFPIAYFWGLRTDGLFQNQAEVQSHVGPEGELLQPNASPGDIRFVDLNGDGVIDAGDRTQIGNPTPDWTFGLTLGADYKGFDLNIFLQGALGNQIFNGTRRHDLTSSNMPVRFLNRWTGEGTSNEIPRMTISDPNGNFAQISDFYIENGDYLRVKDIQLGYTLPQNILETIKIQRVRFYLSANNLLTFTKYTGFDPEIGARGSLDIGVDRGIYPQARTYRLGMNLTF